MKIRSIFTRTFIFFLLFTFILVSALWLTQNSFLPGYYKDQKIKIINSYLVDIDNSISLEGFSQNSLEKIETYSELLNGRIIIFDLQGNFLLYEGMQGQMRDARISEEQISRVLLGETLFDTTSNVRGNTEFLSVLSAGANNIYLLLTPFQAIEDAISISQGFFFYLFIAGMLLALILSWIFAGMISKPLVGLNKIAKNMASLNFEKKWISDRYDEIGELGGSLNILAENLENAISDLKSELAKEKNMDKMRKGFVARVSHELQTPIAIINGYIEALIDEIPQTKEEKVHYLKIIESEIIKISHLIRDLLDLSQLESGTFKISMENFDYFDLLEKRLDNFGILLGEKNISLEKEYPDKTIYINGDSYRIEQVLNNIIQNAVNHTPEGGNIKISVKETESGWLTEVYNEGEHLSEDVLQMIWEAFYKAKEKKEGTGIGLAIVKNIIELHGGRYGARNWEKGVCVYFELNK